MPDKTAQSGDTTPFVYIPFPGHPRLYRRIAIWSGVGIFVWLYGGFASIQYFVYGQTWPLGWKPILLGLVFTAWFARFFYQSMMRLDTQYGSGSGWRLVKQTVKLPEQRPKKRRRQPDASQRQ